MSEPERRDGEKSGQASRRDAASGGLGGPGLPPIDVREFGGKQDGERQVLDKRLFMQLLVYRTPHGESPRELLAALAHAFEERGIGSVLYADVADPRGIGLLTWSEDPDHFVSRVRPVFDETRAARLVLDPAFTMFGRTYSSGHEPRLAWTLLERPREMISQPAWPWAVWYPLRRSGAFARLEPQEQSSILREHAAIGFAYGQDDLAHDVRLACHGLDANDNEFVIGLVGKDLHPLSHIVQTMRKTKQTSEYIRRMGPFFVGRVAQRTAEPGR